MTQAELNKEIWPCIEKKRYKEKHSSINRKWANSSILCRAFEIRVFNVAFLLAGRRCGARTLFNFLNGRFLNCSPCLTDVSEFECWQKHSNCKTLKSFFKKTICKIGFGKLYLTALEDKRHYLTNNRTNKCKKKKKSQSTKLKEREIEETVRVQFQYNGVLASATYIIC